MYYNIYNENKCKYILSYPFSKDINYTEAKWVASVFYTKEDALLFLKDNYTNFNDDDNFIIEESFNYVNSV